LKWRLRLGGGTVSRAEAEKLTTLICNKREIFVIDAVQHFTNLELLELRNNSIIDLSYLENLKKLKELWLTDNKIENVGNISGLNNLEILGLGENLIVNIDNLLVEIMWNYPIFIVTRKVFV